MSRTVAFPPVTSEAPKGAGLLRSYSLQLDGNSYEAAFLVFPTQGAFWNVRGVQTVNGMVYRAFPTSLATNKAVEEAVFTRLSSDPLEASRTKIHGRGDKDGLVKRLREALRTLLEKPTGEWQNGTGGVKDSSGSETQPSTPPKPNKEWKPPRPS